MIKEHILSETMAGDDNLCPTEGLIGLTLIRQRSCDNNCERKLTFQRNPVNLTVVQVFMSRYKMFMF